MRPVYRRIRRVENVLLDRVANFCPDPTERVVLFHDHHAMSFRDRFENRLLVERLIERKSMISAEISSSSSCSAISARSERSAHSKQP